MTKLPDKAPEGSRKRPRESSFLQKKENVVISSYRSYSQFKKRILSAQHSKIDGFNLELQNEASVDQKTAMEMFLAMCENGKLVRSL